MLDEAECERARMGPARVAKRAPAMTAPALPIIVVHGLDHAVGALRAAARIHRPIMLASAPEAGVYAGPGWFRALIEAARAAVPDACFSVILDCGGEAGAALAAIRAGVECVLFTGRADVARRLADIADQHGVRLETTRPTATLDLGVDFFASVHRIEQRCFDYAADRVGGLRCTRGFG